MLCDASDMGRVDDPSARTYTAISRRKRTRLLARDFQRCTVPGCRSHRFLDLHHIVAREEGGTDADDNLTTLCAGHHRLLHRGRLALSGSAPGALVVRRIQDASP